MYTTQQELMDIDVDSDLYVTVSDHDLDIRHVWMHPMFCFKF